MSKKDKGLQKMTTQNPIVSVIMPTYNRCEFLKESLDSILTQTFKNFELIIIDDCSIDGTQKLIEQYAASDKRIVYIRNKKHQDYNYGLRLGCKLAKGKYIARMDDDDISLPTRFKKQVAFLDNNPDIAVVGTFFELFGNNPHNLKPWVKNSLPKFVALDAFYDCPICHPTVMMRKSFLQEKGIGYEASAVYAEDTMLWVDIILAGGKIANIPEVLLKYRIGDNRVSTRKDTRPIQYETVLKARIKLWSACFPKRIAKKLAKLSLKSELHQEVKICNALFEIAKKNSPIFPEKSIYEYLVHMKISSQQMHICLAGDNNIATQMCVCMTSIVSNKLSFDTIDFFILENDISDENKKLIKQLESQNVSIEFIRIDVKMFETRCPPTGQGCVHVPIQTYFRYLIPQLKPEYEKVLYLDCDMVVRSSLNQLWQTDLGDNYAAVVQEFYFEAADRMLLKVPIVFNAGMLLLNNKKLVEDNISDKLFENTEKNKDKIVYVDQDILNYTFKNKVIWVSPKFNAGIDLWRPGTCAKSIYTNEQMWYAKNKPVIVHYNGPNKPWKDNGYKELLKYQPFVNNYFKILKLTPYKLQYWKKKAKDFIKDYLYAKEQNEDKITVRFLCFKFTKNKKLKPSLFLQKINYANSHIWAIEKKFESLTDQISSIDKLKVDQKFEKIEKLLFQMQEDINLIKRRKK